MLAMVAFLITIAVQTFSIELLDLNKVMLVTITLLPTLPMIWAFFIYRQYFLELDEYMQRLTGEAFLWTTGIVCFLSFSYGMLAMKMALPQISLAFVLPVVFGGHGLALQLLLLENSREK